MSQKAGGSVREDEAAQRGKRRGQKKKKSKNIHLLKPLLPNPTELEDFEVDLKLNLD